MIYLDIERIMGLRGISSPQKYLMDNGFSSDIAQRILHNRNSYIKYHYLERICLLLHCTPNDVLTWQPFAGVDKAQPLFALVHNTQDVLDKLKSAPIEKLNKFSEWLAQHDEKK